MSGDNDLDVAVTGFRDAARAEVERLTKTLTGARKEVVECRADIDRYAAERDAIAEKIAVAIETEGSDAHWAATFLNGLNHAARIAREVGGQHV